MSGLYLLPLLAVEWFPLIFLGSMPSHIQWGMCSMVVSNVRRSVKWVGLSLSLVIHLFSRWAITTDDYIIYKLDLFLSVQQHIALPSSAFRFIFDINARRYWWHLWDRGEVFFVTTTYNQNRFFPRLLHIVDFSKSWKIKLLVPQNIKVKHKKIMRTKNDKDSPLLFPFFLLPTDIACVKR